MIEAIIRHKDKDFHVAELEPVLSADFLKSIVKIGNHLASDYKKTTMEDLVKSIRKFGLFLAKLPHSSRIPVDLKNGIAPLHSKGDWIHFLNEFSHHIQNNNPQRQVSKWISHMDTWLRHMAGEMICPAGLSVPNHLPSSPGNSKTKKGSILRAKLSDEAEAALQSAAKELGLDASEGLGEDLAAVAKGVFYDLIDQYSELQELSSENLLLLVQSTLEKRLERIYIGAIDRFKSAVAKREEGKRLVDKGLPYMEVINDWLTYDGSFKYRDAKPILARVRELTDDQFESGIHAWCAHYHQFPGLHPYEGQTDEAIRIRYVNELTKKRRSVDCSTNTMIEYQGASRDLTIAAYLIITFETCANAGSVQNLTLDSKKDITSSLAVVDWVKDRARYVLSKFDVRRDLGLSSVIDTIAEATENYRSVAIRGDGKSLFLHAYPAEASAKNRQKAPGRFLVRPSGDWFNKHAKAMVKEINGGDWTATAKDIRASILLAHALKFGTASAQNLAQHTSSRTTIGYVNTPEMKLKHEEKIRAFQEWLQVLVTINIDDIPNKLGLAEDAYEEIRQRIVNTRFGGIQCSDPLSGYQHGSEAGKPCNKIMMCMTCEKRMNVFVASEENVAHLLNWRDALNDAFQSGKVDKNNVNWTLWGVFIDTMYDRMAKSPKHKGLLADVQNRIAENENPYHRIFLRSA